MLLGTASSRSAPSLWEAECSCTLASTSTSCSDAKPSRLALPVATVTAKATAIEMRSILSQGYTTLLKNIGGANKWKAGRRIRQN
jgi:hypothetical protein